MHGSLEEELKRAWGRALDDGPTEPWADLEAWRMTYVPSLSEWAIDFGESVAKPKEWASSVVESPLVRGEWRFWVQHQAIQTVVLEGGDRNEWDEIGSEALGRVKMFDYDDMGYMAMVFERGARIMVSGADYYKCKEYEEEWDLGLWGWHPCDNPGSAWRMEKAGMRMSRVVLRLSVAHANQSRQADALLSVERCGVPDRLWVYGMRPLKVRGCCGWSLECEGSGTEQASVALEVTAIRR